MELLNSKTVKIGLTFKYLFDFQGLRFRITNITKELIHFENLETTQKYVQSIEAFKNSKFVLC